MNALLAVLAATFATLLFLQRLKTERQWRRIASIVETVNSGKRPDTFILHGRPAFLKIGLGLEDLADQRDKLVRQLTEEEFNLQTILSSMVEGVMVVDTSRCIRLVNASFLGLFELTGSPLGRTVLQTLRNAAIEDVVRTALNAEDAEAREITISSSSRHLAMSVAPVRDDAGNVLGVAAIFHDITRLKQLEQVRKEFVANVSHELRTPLSIFQGYLEMLQESPEMPREEVMHNLQVLRKHSGRLNALVEDLLTIARLESRQDDLELAALPLDNMFNSLQEDWCLKFAAKSVRLRSEIAPGCPRVLADSFRLEQVFHNLLENALKYTPVNGEVSLHATCVNESPTASDPKRPARREIEIRVSDTGSGIPPADLPHIFERFYRADKARSRALGGTGLGLSIVKHIVQLHGGSVRAESAYGSGTSVVIRLPAV